jgi:hypothetical protein
VPCKNLPAFEEKEANIPRDCSKQDQISHAIEANNSRYLYFDLPPRTQFIIVFLPPSAPHITTAAAAKQYEPRD